MTDVDVRERILREATRLFAEKGYGSTSVRELVEAAGVTKPTLYYHFGNKDSLFLKVVHAHLDNMERMVHDLLARPGTVRERLHRFISRYVEDALANPHAVRLLMTVQHPTDDRQPVVDVMSMHMRAFALLEDAIREGMATGELRPSLDAGAAALAFIGTLNLYLMGALHGFPLQRGYPDTLLDLFYDGVAPR